MTNKMRWKKWALHAANSAKPKMVSCHIIYDYQQNGQLRFHYGLWCHCSVYQYCSARVKLSTAVSVTIQLQNTKNTQTSWGPVSAAWATASAEAVFLWMARLIRWQPMRVRTISMAVWKVLTSKCSKQDRQWWYRYFRPYLTWRRRRLSRWIYVHCQLYIWWLWQFCYELHRLEQLWDTGYHCQHHKPYLF